MQKEANRILVELESRGITPAQEVENRNSEKTLWSITVFPADLAAARTVLVECDLPREKHAGFAAMAESSSLIPSKGEERAKLIALSGELERTFETYDRVVSTRVHIVLPEKELLAVDRTDRQCHGADQVRSSGRITRCADNGGDGRFPGDAGRSPADGGTERGRADATKCLHHLYPNRGAARCDGQTRRHLLLCRLRQPPRRRLWPRPVTAN